MDRRAFLALLTGSGAALAGCNQQAGTATPTRTAADTPSPSSTRTPGGETPTDPPTAEPTAEPTDTDTDTETDTETPTAEARAARAIDEATRALGETVDAYEAAAGDGGDVTLLSVDVTVAFSTDRLADPLGRAETALDRAGAAATDDQSETVERLRRAATWLRNLGEAQAAAAEAFGTYVTLRDAVYAGEAATAASAASDLEPLVDPVESGLDAATESVVAEDAALVSGVTGELFEAKNAQLRAAAGTFRLLVEEGEPTATAVATFAAGVADYEERQFGQAKGHFREARDALDDANRALSADDRSASVVGERTANLACAAGHLSAAADDLKTSVEAGADNNGSRRRRFLDSATDRLSGCGGIFAELSVTERVRSLE